MLPFFWATFLFVLAQRLLELRLAKRNAARIRRLGGYEVGSSHYKFLVLLHGLFLFSLALEVHVGKGAALPVWWPFSFSLFLLAQFLRYWCIRTLGIRWNTRILVLPGSAPVKRGPYRLLRHPNYLVVAVEFLTLPLTFNAWLTALFFSLANAWLLLRVRIPLEEQAVYRRGGESS
jgi:methyltransferase